MKTNKITIALLALFAFSSANAEYVVKMQLAKNDIIFVETRSNENMCQATARYVENYAKTIGVNITVNTGYSGNNCNVDIYSIGNFSTQSQLQNVGNYILNLNTGDYTRSSVVYGFQGGFGRSLIWNGNVNAASLWSQR